MSDETQTPPPRQAAEVLYVAEEGDSLAPQLQQQDARERDGATTATS